MTITPTKTFAVGAVATVVGAAILVTGNKHTTAGMTLFIAGIPTMLYGYAQKRKLEMNTKG